MKILVPHFSKFSTGDALEYARLVVNRCRERQPPMSPTEPQVNAVEAAADALSANFKRELGNALSDDLTVLDMERDRLIIGLRTTAEGQSYHFDIAIAKAASQLLAAIDHYGPSISKLHYEIETTTINSLLDRISKTPELTAAIATLGLGNWMTRMRTANDSFHLLYSSRTGSITDNASVSTMELRKNLRDALRDLFSHLNAHFTLTKDANLEVIVSDINTLTKRFNQLADERLGASVTTPEVVEVKK
jgi:hypothetical protein